VVIDTRVTHAHATGGYATRRQECDQAAEILGVPLREATLDQADLLPEPLNRRVRHVVTENQRVLDVAAALERGDLDVLGPLLAAGHASLRDDFEVSCPELDAAVRGALDGGALAARMTGGGFGGSAVALSPPHLVDEITRSCRHAAAAIGAPVPVVRTVRPSRGARRVG
jgi:galactokinase